MSIWQEVEIKKRTGSCHKSDSKKVSSTLLETYGKRVGLHRIRNKKIRRENKNTTRKMVAKNS